MSIVKPSARRRAGQAIALAAGGVLWLSLVPARPAEGGIPPPAPGYSTAARGTGSATAPVRYVAFGGLAVVPEQSTLNDVVQAAGRGSIDHAVDADGSRYWLCYTLQDQRVWVVSNATTGGPDHRVTGVRADRIDGVRPAAACPALPAWLQPVSIDGEVWIGTAADAARALLGAPTSTYGWWQAFEYRTQLPGSCEPAGYDRLNWLMLQMKKGRVAAVRAGQVTSC